MVSFRQKYVDMQVRGRDACVSRSMILINIDMSAGTFNFMFLVWPLKTDRYSIVSPRARPDH